jgi:hypothetical protein
MTNTATFRRSAAAVGLVLAVVLMAAWTVLAPEFPPEFRDKLAAVEEGGTPAVVSAVAFTLAQLPFMIGVLGIGHLLRPASPRLANIGTSLAVIGGFGHSVYGGITMVHLEMAGDATNRDVHAAILEQVESGPALAFMAMGLLGTVIGILMLSIGLFRARAGRRWVGPALWAFLVVEFAGSAISDWSSHLAILLYGSAFLALAVTIWSSPTAVWDIRGASLPEQEPVARARL